MPELIYLQNHKKIFFASDFHLGMPDTASSLGREKRIVRWLESIEEEASDIFLMGDLFNFWFEYREVVPKGFIRFLGKLASLADKGVQLHIFTGNHDPWMFGYLEEQLNAHIYRKPQVMNLMGKTFYLDHGDSLGLGSSRFKPVKEIFENPICQQLFSWLHPDLGIRLASYLLAVSRALKHKPDDQFLGEEKEWMVTHVEEILKTHPKIDYFVFGHRHLPLFLPLDDVTCCVNLGDWVTHFSYAVFDGQKLELKFYE